MTTATAPAANPPLTLAGPVATLDQMRPGQSGTIVDVSVKGAQLQRLQEIGLIAGERIELRAVAPMKDPIAVRLRGGQFSLRKADAAMVRVACD